MKTAGKRVVLISVGVMIALGCVLPVASIISDWRVRRPFASLPAPLNELLPAYFAQLPWYDAWISRNAYIIPRSKNPGYKWWVPTAAKLHARRAESELFQRQGNIERKLSELGTNAWPAVPCLLDHLEIPDNNAPAKSIRLLSLIGAENDPELASYFHSKTNLQHLVEIFSGLIVLPTNAYQMMIGRSAYRGPESAGLAMKCLGLCGAAARPALPAIMQSLSPTRGNDRLCTNAIAALAALGPYAKEALPSLKKMVRDGTPSLYERFERAGAVEAVAKIAPEDPETIVWLRPLLRDRHGLVRVKAAISLWRLKTPDDEILPVLGDALDGKLPSAQIAALQAVAEMGTNADSLKPKVESHLIDSDEAVRSAAELAASSLGKAVP